MEDIVGMEERPNLAEELRRYSLSALAFLMLDHTYALPAQKQPAAGSPTAPVTTSPIASSPSAAPAPASPVKMSPTAPVAHESPPTSAAPVESSPISSAAALALSYKTAKPPDDDTASVISSLEGERPPAPGGSDTETAPEGEDEGKTRCICEFTHDDGYMICCDRCGEWQHVDCMGVDRANIPDAYMCELCQPRPVDRRHARALQQRKRAELSALAGDSDSDDAARPGRRRRRLLTITTYSDTSGSCVTTYNSSLPVLPPPQPALPLPKRGPKRPKKAEVMRKGNKRKLTEKRVKRKKDMLLNRNKYNSSLSNQSHWRDLYELAMTNHYSPELRAKVMKYSSKLGSTPNMASAITAHLCTTVPHAGGKILIATKDLKENTPVIELRGKYMLSNQHRPQIQNSARAGSQKPGPFVFFYRLPKDNTQICIDTRTYGNEARFVRRSCKPNAELQHCIVKGTLHVYLVTTNDIPSNTEITVGHDTNGGKQPCACGNPKYCKANGLTPMMPRKSLEYPQREKRSRNRCFSSSSPVSPPLASLITTPVKDIPSAFTSIKQEKKSPIKHEYPPMSPVKEPLFSLDFNAPTKAFELKEEKEEIDLTAKEEMKPDLDELDFVKIEPPMENLVDKIEPEVKSEIEFEPEKEPEPESEPEPEPEAEPEQVPPIEMPVKHETNEMNIKLEPQIKEEVLPAPTISDEIEKKCDENIQNKIDEKVIEPKVEQERPVTRELTARSACHDRSSRSSRTTCVNQDSLDDKTDDSQDKLPTTASKEKEKEKRKMVS